MGVRQGRKRRLSDWDAGLTHEGETGGKMEGCVGES